MTLFLEVLESTSVFKLKKMIQGKTCISREVCKDIVAELFSGCIITIHNYYFNRDVNTEVNIFYIIAILKVQPVDQQLFVMSANNCQLDKYIELSKSTAHLYEYELTSSTAKVTYPAIVGLAIRQEDGSFESLEVTSYSDLQWPELMSDFPNDNDSEKRAAFNKKYEKMLQELNVTKPGPSKRATRK